MVNQLQLYIDIVLITWSTVTKLFRPWCKKNCVLVKLRFKKYIPRLNLIEHQLLKPQVQF